MWMRRACTRRRQTAREATGDQWEDVAGGIVDDVSVIRQTRLSPDTQKKMRERPRDPMPAGLLTGLPDHGAVALE